MSKLAALEASLIAPGFPALNNVGTVACLGQSPSYEYKNVTLDHHQDAV